MPNENNLIPLSKRTKSEQRRIQSEENAEMVMIPIVITRDDIGNIKNYATFDNLIIPEENK